ncbi:MAG: ATP-binding protein [Planctomycetes bacterium]|nr:ATP-binding protein [Planctomycetota bacterium]
MAKRRLLLAGSTKGILEGLARTGAQRFGFDPLPIAELAELESAVRRSKPGAVAISAGSRPPADLEPRIAALLDEYPDLVVVTIDGGGRIALRALLVAENVDPDRFLAALRAVMPFAGELPIEEPNGPPAEGDANWEPYEDDAAHLADERRWVELLLCAAVAGRDPLSVATQVGEEERLLVLGRSGFPRASVSTSQESEQWLRDSAQVLRSSIDARMRATHREFRSTALERLCTSMQLGQFERGCIVICLAVQFDAQIRSLCRAASGGADVRWPSSELLCRCFGSRSEELAALVGLLARDEKLQRHRILLASSVDVIGAVWGIDPHVGGLLLRATVPWLEVESRRSSVAQTYWARAESAGQVSRFLVDRVRAGKTGPAVLSLVGPSGSGRLATICRALAPPGAAAEDIDLRSLAIVIDARLLASAGDYEHSLRRALRWCLLLQQHLVVDHFEALLADETRRGERLDLLFAAMREYAGVTFLLSTERWSASEWLNADDHLLLEFERPSAGEAEAMWRSETRGEAQDIAGAALPEFAARFRFLPGQAREASERARQRAVLLSRPWRLEMLEDVCSSMVDAPLREHASRLPPARDWSSLILPDDRLRQLEDLVAHVRYRREVLEVWGFEEGQRGVRGVTALFSGASGTGKSMAAEVVAKELGMDLWRIDLSRVISKYIGETEARLREVFDAAEEQGILFFDEADALFGKRTEVKDAHDRYANQEVAYLLQRMEDFAGVTILATNLRRNLDDAFVRRIRFIVDFPAPDAMQRRKLWRRSLPSGAPLAGDVDLEFLAQRFELTGGAISNAALAAAIRARAAGAREIAMPHLVSAVRRELEKLGRRMDPEQLGCWTEEPAMASAGASQ